MSDPLPPIPTPTAQMWRQVRLQYLPVIIFVAGLITAAVIWTKWVAPPTWVGEVEAVHSDVRSTETGLLLDLKADYLQSVRAGQVIGRVVTTSPQVLEASLAVIRAEIDMMRITLNPIVAQQRTTLDIERLNLDWMSKRVELASLQGQLLQAEATLVRTTSLHQQKLVKDEEYDIAKSTRDSLQEQVKAEMELITKVGAGLQKFSQVMPSDATPEAGLRAAINHKEQELRLLEAKLSPVPLVAPIDGVVTLIHHRSGENVAAGDLIVQLSATTAERIVGFLRQPLTLEPKPGTTVEVRTRTWLRHTGTAKIAQVGRQFEPISPSILTAMHLPVSNVPTEYGLRVLVTAPAGLALKPGEQVDLILQP